MRRQRAAVKSFLPFLFDYLTMYAHSLHMQGNKALKTLNKNNTMKTQTQHTRGPWNVGDDSPNEYEGPTIENADNVIAVILIDDINDSSPEERANARLIAAAPDLLAALKMCEDVIGRARLEGKLSDNALSPVNDALVAARAAIDKTR